MEEKQLDERLVPRKRDLCRESDDDTGEASPKKARSDQQCTSQNPGADEARINPQGESTTPNDARADQQGTNDRPTPHEFSSDHQGPSELPTPNKASSDHQDPSEVPNRDETRSDQQGTIDRSSPDEAMTDHEGPRGLQTPDQARTDHQNSPITDGARLNEERHFYELYTEVLDHIKERKGLRDQDITEGVDTVERAFKYSQGNRFSDIDFHQPQNVCGYLFRGGGAMAAGLTRYRVLQAARKCEELRNILCAEEGQGGLRVVSVGGGPAADALGLCSALVELGFPQDRVLTITIVDPIEQWEECVDHVKRLLSDGDHGQASLLFRRNRVTVDFLPESVPVDVVSHRESPRKDEQDFPTSKCYAAMNEADVILVQRVLSNQIMIEVPTVVENIHSAMKEDAFIIVINTSLTEKNGSLLYGGFQRDFRKFRLLDLSEVDLVDEEENKYRLLESHSRFGRNDVLDTKAQIAVLRKKPASANGR